MRAWRWRNMKSRPCARESRRNGDHFHTMPVMVQRSYQAISVPKSVKSQHYSTNITSHHELFGKSVRVALKLLNYGERHRINATGGSQNSTPHIFTCFFIYFIISLRDIRTERQAYAGMGWRLQCLRFPVSMERRYRAGGSDRNALQRCCARTHIYHEPK